MTEAPTSILGSGLPRRSITSESGGSASPVFLQKAAFAGQREALTIPTSDDAFCTFFLPRSVTDELKITVQKPIGTYHLVYNSVGDLTGFSLPIGEAVSRFKNQSQPDIFPISHRNTPSTRTSVLRLNTLDKTVSVLRPGHERTYALHNDGGGEFSDGFIDAINTGIHFFCTVRPSQSVISIYSERTDTSRLFEAVNSLPYQNVHRDLTADFARELTAYMMI